MLPRLRAIWCLYLSWLSWPLVAASSFLRYLTWPSRTPSYDPLPDMKTAERAYRINDNGRMLKRSLKANELPILEDGSRLVPKLVVERLENEAASMRYIKKHTDIPVPTVLELYEEDGARFLWTEFIDGIEMDQLSEAEQRQIIPQIRTIVKTLQQLRARKSGGPTGILCPSAAVEVLHSSRWTPQYADEEDFVFCHGDLSQGNILVDRSELKVVAIIDWEYSGFYPSEHEIPFFESSEASGKQIGSDRLRPVVNKIIDFWKRSQIAD